jgi:hypothetical protein
MGRIRGYALEATMGGATAGATGGATAGATAARVVLVATHGAGGAPLGHTVTVAEVPATAVGVHANPRMIGCY